MACAGKVLVWWDRDFDTGGRPIRSDVRAAGRELWEQACQQTFAAVDECGPAAKLMEYAVAQVSRYLDRIGAPLNSRKHGLVMVAYVLEVHLLPKFGNVQLRLISRESIQMFLAEKLKEKLSWRTVKHIRMDVV